jgi:hypothetical protein
MEQALVNLIIMMTPVWLMLAFIIVEPLFTKE